jgi:uncharacterized protein YxjI
MMSAQFCMKCGKPLQPSAAFCAGCGNPVGGPPGAAPGGAPAAATAPGAAPAAVAAPALVDAASAAPSATPPPVSDGSALRAALGLQGGQKFLLQHEMLSGGRNYRVMNHEKRHLFTVREGRVQALTTDLLGGMRMREGLTLNVGGRPLSYSWTVADAPGNPQGAIAIEVQGNTAVSTLSDATGAPVLSIRVQRGMMGGLTATAASSDGRTLLEAKGNLLHHNFSIHDASGAEVAKIHEAWASVRDTYNLDLTGNTDPLFPLIFAILIDREKETK